MRYLTHQQPHGATPDNQWLRRIGVAGFVFFLAKGMAWIVAATWFFYWE